MVLSAADNRAILAACAVKPRSNSLVGLFNIAIYQEHQDQGFGWELLRFVLSRLTSKRINRIEQCTGIVGQQLRCFQQALLFALGSLLITKRKSAVHAEIVGQEETVISVQASFVLTH